MENKNNLITLDNLNELTDINITKELLVSPQFSAQYSQLLDMSSKIDGALKALKSKILDCLCNVYIEEGEPTVSSDDFIFTYVSATSAVTVDSAKLKKDFPDIYKQCLKTSAKSASLRITAIKKEDAE